MNKKILIADDEQNIVISIEFLLRREGFEVLVAGDADTDYEMLTLPEVDIRLLVNRNQTGLISTLYQDPRILLQGLDQATGRFRPFRESKTL